MTFYNFFKVLLAPLTSIVFPCKVYGKENYSKEKAVICCNHYSGLDVAIISEKFLWGHCRCIAKEELFHSKMVAWFLRKCGAIAIKRGESDMAAFRQANQVLQNGEQLVIFPEGTRNADPEGDLQPILPGAMTFALRNQCPIIPMVFLRKTKPFHRTFLLVGKPIDTTQFSDLHPKDAREQATALLERTLKDLHASLRRQKSKQKLIQE